MRKKKLVKSIIAVSLSACMVVGSTSVAFAKGTDFKYDAEGNVIGTTGHVDADGHVATDYEYKLDKDGNMQYDEDGNVIKELIKKDDEEKCDHVWVKRLTKSPTCTEKGEWTIFCGNCGESKTESIAATGHSWGDWTVTKAATCTEDGEEARTCANCGDTETKTIQATGHKWLGTSEETKAPTCEENGYTKKTCGTCGETETTTIPATGHNWGDWTVTKAATCTEDGEEARTCATCGKTETKTIQATGHKLIATSEVITAPTCTKEGKSEKTCATCGETVTTTIPAKGHGEEYTKGTEKGYAATCTEAGKTDVVRCKDCDAVLKEAEVIPALGHAKPDAATSITVVKEATCTEEGEVSYSCTRCHKTITEKTAINPDNHVWTATGSCKKCGKKKPATDA